MKLRDRWFWRWVPGERKTVWLCTIVAGITVGYLLGFYHADAQKGRVYVFGDFFAFWSFGRIMLTHGAALLYNANALHAAQVALGMPAGGSNPFGYPPVFLLLVWPLGLVSFFEAYPLWVGATLAFYLLALGAGQDHKRALVLAGLCVPTTAAGIGTGQTGFLHAALLLGGARLATRRPAAAGVLFGLLAFKPQFGLLVPVALIAARQWRCIGATAATVLGLCAIVTVLFGLPIWMDWLHSLALFEADFRKTQAANRMLLMAPTVVSNLRALGVPGTIAWLAQVAAIGVSGAVTWRAWRRRSPLAVPILLAATFLATPHALVYDLPGLSAAALLFAAWRLRTEGGLDLPELAVLLLTLLSPMIMTSAVMLPIGAWVTALFLFVLYRADQAIVPPVAQIAKA